MSSITSRKGLPSWAWTTFIAAALLLLILVGWKVLKSAHASEEPVAVHPGMVDFHKEAQKGAVDRPHLEADEDDRAKGKEKDGDNDGDGK